MCLYIVSTLGSDVLFSPFEGALPLLFGFSDIVGGNLSKKPVRPHPSFAFHLHISPELQLKAVEFL